MFDVTTTLDDTLMHASLASRQGLAGTNLCLWTLMSRQSRLLVTSLTTCPHQLTNPHNENVTPEKQLRSDTI